MGRARDPEHVIATPPAPRIELGATSPQAFGERITAYLVDVAAQIVVDAGEWGCTYWYCLPSVHVAAYEELHPKT